MLTHLSKTISAAAPSQALLGMIADPYTLFSALGHVWIWGVFDRSSRSPRPFLKAADPDPGRRAGVLALGVEEKGGRYHTIDVEIEGPTITGSGLMYRLRSVDDRLLVTVISQIRQMGDSSKLVLDIEASYVLDWKSLFLSPIFGGKIDLDAFINHLVEDHLKNYIKERLEPKSVASNRGAFEPVVYTMDDIRNVIAGLGELSKSIDKGLISIAGSDFVLVLEVKNGAIKESMYRDDKEEVWGDEAIKRASVKSGRVRIRVYNMSVTDILLRLSK